MASIWFFRREKKPWFPYADCLATGMALAYFFGRMGCFVAHDHPGTQTMFWLGVPGMCPDKGPAVACHDLGLYEAFWALGLFITFWFLDKKPRFPGFFVAVLFMAYGPTRLVLDAFRHPDLDTRYFGLTPAQYGSVLLTFIGVWMFVRQKGKPPVRQIQQIRQVQQP